MNRKGIREYCLDVLGGINALRSGADDDALFSKKTAIELASSLVQTLATIEVAEAIEKVGGIDVAALVNRACEDIQEQAVMRANDPYRYNNLPGELREIILTLANSVADAPDCFGYKAVAAYEDKFGKIALPYDDPVAADLVYNWKPPSKQPRTTKDGKLKWRIETP